MFQLLCDEAGFLVRAADPSIYAIMWVICINIHRLKKSSESCCSHCTRMNSRLWS
jgi:hypothetical protein